MDDQLARLLRELIQLTDDDPHQEGPERPDTCGIPGHVVSFCETCDDGSQWPCTPEQLRLLAPKIKAALEDLTRENERLRAESDSDVEWAYALMAERDDMRGE